MTDDTNTRPSRAAPGEVEAVLARLQSLAADLTDDGNSIAELGYDSRAKRLYEFAREAQSITDALAAAAAAAPGAGQSELADRLEALASKATPGRWWVEPYHISPGTPDEITRGMLMAGEQDVDDGMATGVIDEKDMPGYGGESMSRDLDLIVALREALPAILAALRASPDGWHAIDSAPRDGSRFLAYEAGDGAQRYECWWQDDFVEWSGWQNDWVNEPAPTHWRPLPPPPAQGGG